MACLLPIQTPRARLEWIRSFPGKPIINLPGCPPDPYNLLGVVLGYVTMGKLPALDEYGRRQFAYEPVIHENCQRRAHFDAGRPWSVVGDRRVAPVDSSQPVLADAR